MWNDIVLDTGAFLQNKIEDFRLTSKNLWTIEEVLAEVRDESSRKNLTFTLSAHVKLRRPTLESCNTIIEFAKKTGDYPALSRTDILVLALTYEISQENEKLSSSSNNNNNESTNTPPIIKPIEETNKPTTTSRLAEPGKSWASIIRTTTTQQSFNDNSITNLSSIEEITEKINQQKLDVEKEQEDDTLWPSLPDRNIKRGFELQPRPVPISQEEEESEEEEEEEEEEELAKPVKSTKKIVNNSSRILSFNPGVVSLDIADDEDDGKDDWAKPGSFNSGWAANNNRKKNIQDEEEEGLLTGCATVDYAIQNILLQLKIGVVSIDGRRIRSIKNWVLKCDACLRIFPATEHKLFCPSCGHDSLARLAYSINENGERRYHYSRIRRPKTQGTRYSIPKNSNLLLREDQLLSGIWAQRAKAKTSNVSMFGEDVNDALDLGMKTKSNIKVGYGSKNPNSKRGRERRGAKKKD